MLIPVRFLFLPALCFAFFQISAQKTVSGFIRDAHSEEPVPFASIGFPNSSIGTLTDSAGRFSLSVTEWPSDSILVSCVGYQPYYILIDPSKDNITANVLMERGTFIEGAQVKVKVNRGLLVWRKIVENKPRNDRFRFDNFSYELYNKLELDLKNVNFEKFGKFKPLRPITDLINQNIDTSEGIRYLPTFLTEAISDYFYQKSPKKRREVIRAVNLTGVKNESVNKVLGGMDQVVNEQITKSTEVLPPELFVHLNLKSL